MKKFCLSGLLLILGCVAFPHRSPAPLIVKSGEDVTYVAPGSDEVPNQKDAQAQFDAALAKEKSGKLAAAVAGYKKTVHRFPKSSVAPTAQYKVGELLEKMKNPFGASEAYEHVIVLYPHSTDFNSALDGEFRIGTSYLEGLKQKILGVPTLPSRDRAIAIFQVIVKNAPFSRYAPMAQFNIGQAYQLQSDYKGAITSYQIVVDKYPTDPIAADALYQIGYSYLSITRDQSNDKAAAQHAQESFEDFLAAYPNNERASQAKEDLSVLAGQQTGGSLKIAEYYYGQKQFRAAVVYYNDVIRQQPNSPQSDRAKARLDQIRAKYGDKYFTDTPTAANAGKGVTPKVGDGRLQAQTDTAKRPDYLGPPVSVPTPPPAVTAGPGAPLGMPGTPNTSLPPATGNEPKPPTVPEGEQPALPSQ